MEPGDLPAEIAEPRAEQTNTGPMTLDEIEREHILTRLEACDNNRSEAARQLGISRNTLARKLKSYGFDDSDDGD